MAGPGKRRWPGAEKAGSPLVGMIVQNFNESGESRNQVVIREMVGDGYVLVEFFDAVMFVMAGTLNPTGRMALWRVDDLHTESVRGACALFADETDFLGWYAAVQAPVDENIGRSKEGSSKR